MSLVDIKKGKTIVKGFKNNLKVINYLKNLGVIIDTEIEVLVNGVNGVVIIVRQGKIAISKDLAELIEVQ